MENEYLLKLDNLLGEMEELHIIRGQFIEGIQRNTNDDRKAKYYEFDLKVKKVYGESKYDNSYNYYHFIMSVENSKKYSLDDMKEYKGNEVIVLADMSAKIKKTEKYKYTILQGVYAYDIGILNKLDDTVQKDKVVNL